ncbi:MAG: hypothetical protein FJ291_24625 [Planctomycetes bacterium]|nr:hypothetical protein [Planctomycetota bacterium]
MSLKNSPPWMARLLGFALGAVAGFFTGALFSGIRDWPPWMTTLLGGALALIGGFASNYLLSRIADDRARRDFRTAKLESVLVKSVEAVNLIHEMRSKMHGRPDEKPPPYYVNLAMAQIGLVASAYCPGFQAAGESMKSTIGDFCRKQDEFYQLFTNSGGQPGEAKVRTALQAMESSWEAVQKAQETLVAKLEEVSRATFERT